MSSLFNNIKCTNNSYNHNNAFPSIYSSPPELDDMIDDQSYDSDGFVDIDFLINSSTNNNYLGFYDPIDTQELCHFDQEEEISFELRQSAGSKRTIEDALEEILPTASKRRNVRITPILPEPPKHLQVSHFRCNAELTLNKIMEEIDGHLAIKSFQEDTVLKIEKQEASGTWIIETKKKGHVCEFQFQLYKETSRKDIFQGYIFEGKVLHGEKELFYSNFSELKTTLAQSVGYN